MNQEKRSPIRRSEALKPLSREHHDGLLLCWKIREGLAKGISADRVVRYTVYFFNTFLKPHFEEEETYLFSLLPDNDPMKIEALAQHDILRAMVNGLDNASNETEWLNNFAAELDRHIRYEERQLFGYIEEKADQSLLAETGRKLAELNQTTIKEEWTDTFWQRKEKLCSRKHANMRYVQ